jgi:type III secretory pathway component EscT
MSSEEKRAGISLAAVFALRMLGLFLILPVFSSMPRTCLPATTWRWSAWRSALTG